MSGEQIVEILLAAMSTLVAIVGLLVRARIIALEGKIDQLDATIQAQKTTSRTTFPRTE